MHGSQWKWWSALDFFSIIWAHSSLTKLSSLTMVPVSMRCKQVKSKVQPCHELLWSRGDLSINWAGSIRRVVKEFNMTYCRTFKLTVELAAMHSTRNRHKRNNHRGRNTLFRFLAISCQTRRWNEWSREKEEWSREKNKETKLARMWWTRRRKSF
jgi:hypothetical protein